MSGPFQPIARRDDKHPDDPSAPRTGEAPDAATQQTAALDPVDQSTQQTAAVEPPPEVADQRTSMQPAAPPAGQPTTVQPGAAPPSPADQPTTVQPPAPGFQPPAAPAVAVNPSPAPVAAPAPVLVEQRRPGFRERGRMRRRLRYLRKLRELQARDLGGLVFDLRRFERKRDDLVAQKIDQIHACDDELRALETALDERRNVRDVHEPGIGGTCPRCFALYGSTDRFCANCGAALGGAVQGPAQVSAPPPPPPPPAVAPPAAAPPPPGAAAPPPAPVPAVAPPPPPAPPDAGAPPR